jgi:protein-glucosylgalactosylhydroxylysine glucosidase
MSRAGSAIVWMLLLAAAASARGAGTDPSFLLRAGLADLPGYFPGYLGNGYLATLTAPRGTETAPAYMVAFMDYTAGDMSRPAQVPGWTEVDFSSSPPGSGLAWLNRARLDERHFAGYSQTLDLHTATLTTSYRYRDRGRDTAVEVTTLVSEAAPHLAATRFTITPDYDGVVHLSFPLILWADHAPRFPLAEMTGPEVEEAVEANGLTLEPRPPATPDREAVWYPGCTEIRSFEGDTASLSLWLEGQATQGLKMAMAATVALPDGVAAETVTLHRDRYRLALDIAIKVERGRRYAFTKYVALSREGWGGNAADDLSLAREARSRGFERLLEEHRAAWARLWQSDILIEGDARAQQVTHSELYYLLASSTAATAFSPGPDALTPDYAAHVFWDSDTWIFPVLLLVHPERALPLVDFRYRTLDAARQRAQAHGYQGAMYPWESDPENGTDQTPHSAVLLADTEIHVTADVAIAQWQYYLATHDREWLRTHGWPVIREVARFWASRSTYNPREHRYEITHVNSVAESHNDIPNDTFTNVSAARALAIAAAAARELGERADPVWEKASREMYVPLAPGGTHHLPFDPSVMSGSEDFGGGPVPLLFLPSLDLPMSPQLRRGDFDFAVRPTQLARAGSSSMGIAPSIVAATTVGGGDEAAALLAANLAGGTLKPPFNVRTETAGNNTGYFLTGSAGYLQSLIYGFTGLRIREKGLVEAYAPVLPASWSSLTLRNVSFRGQRLDIRLARDSSGAVRLTRQPH